MFAEMFLALSVRPLSVDNRLLVDASRYDMIDARVYRTAPDSLHLDASESGNQYFRFPERRVRGDVRMRLTFHYLTARGGTGPVSARVSQYKDKPSAWKVLSDGGFEIPMPVAGRWTRVEHVFTTEHEANTLAVDFRVSGACDCGEAWIDDVSIRVEGHPIIQGP